MRGVPVVAMDHTLLQGGTHIPIPWSVALGFYFRSVADTAVRFRQHSCLTPSSGGRRVKLAWTMGSHFQVLLSVVGGS
jgi:hypothetical protein